MSRPRIRCLLSFDYELFHGRNFGTPEEVLFAPTDRLSERCRALDVLATWFPDICSVWWHRAHGLDDYANRFEEQMRTLVAAGDDVQLHVHPHWLFAEEKDGHWEIDPDHVYLHEIGWGDGEREAVGILRRGVDHLEELLRPVNPEYRCLAYRAAALALEPQGQEHLQALSTVGFQIDTSIIKHVISETDTYWLDYRESPAEPNWRIQPETGWAKPAAKGIYEIPVGTFQAPFSVRLRFMLRRLRAVGRRRGSGMSRDTEQTRLGNLKHLLLMNLRYLTGSPWFTLSCDTKGFDRKMVLAGLRDHVDRHPNASEIMVSVINHPKLMFETECDLLAGFVEDARAEFGDEIDFPTFLSVAREQGV